MGGDVDVAFDLELPHGRCVGVRIPDGEALESLAQALRDEERAHAAAFGAPRRRTWIAGRTALREALARAGAEASAVLPDDRGAPGLPAGIVGSVSHKDRIAVGLVAREGAARIGVDVEIDAPRSIDIASKVLRPEELAALSALPAAARGSELLVRFSAKEAVYKALDPFVRRYVGFREVALTPQPDGTAQVAMHLAQGEGPFRVEVRWLRREDLILTTARVERA